MDSKSAHDLINRFYTAFKNLDAEGMVACYHPEVKFHDPVFQTLQGVDAGDMWRMLILRGGNALTITYSDVAVEGVYGHARWEASYLFTKTNRQVHNKIKASFRFQDNKIIQHDDYFNFWKWSQMAFGLPGYVLGWTPLLQKKVQTESLKALRKFQQKNQ